MRTREEQELYIDEVIQNECSENPKLTELIRSHLISEWELDKKEYDENQLRKQANSDNTIPKASWFENTEIYKAKSWDDLGTVSKIFLKSTAFMMGVELDKRTLQEKLEDVVKLAENILPDVNTNPFFMRIKGKYDAVNQDDQLASYQIALHQSSLADVISVDEVISFANNRDNNHDLKTSLSF